MDVSEILEAVTLRRSPRRRSPPQKAADMDTVMEDGMSPVAKSPKKLSPERRSRSRSPIRKSPKKSRVDARFNLFGAPLVDEEEKNASLANGAAHSNNSHLWHHSNQKDSLPDPSKSADSPLTRHPSFGQHLAQKAPLGLFGQPSTPISHWPPHTATLNQSTNHSLALFGQASAPKSPHLVGQFENFRPFQQRTLFGQASNTGTTRCLFGVSLPGAPPKVVLPSFIDHLDEEIGAWNPEYQVSPPSPPPGILNMPYAANGEEELPDALDPRYDSDWNERLFDPVPGAGVYLGELRDPDITPKDQNVVYASLGLGGEVEILARPYNRRGERTRLWKEGEVSFGDIGFRSCFGGRWVEKGDIEDVKRCAKGRLERKRELDWKREARFEQDVKKFWRGKTHQMKFNGTSVNSY